jgi:hypothetical protein
LVNLLHASAGQGQVLVRGLLRLLHEAVQEHHAPLQDAKDYAGGTVARKVTTDLPKRHKGGLYAYTGVVNDWIVNIRARRVAMHCEPVRTVAAPFG